MRALGDGLVYSPTDLASFFGCEHLTTLELRRLRGEIKKPYFPDPGMRVLEERGMAHERDYLDKLRAKGLSVRDVTERPVAETIAALREGVDVVYQATLSDG